MICQMAWHKLACREWHLHVRAFGLQKQVELGLSMEPHAVQDKMVPGRLNDDIQDELLSLDS